MGNTACHKFGVAPAQAGAHNHGCAWLRRAGAPVRFNDQQR